MRAALLCVLSLCACGIEVREPSPASAPVRAVPAPTLPPPVDPAVFAAAVRAGVRQRSANEAVFEVDAFLAALTLEDLRSGRPSLELSPVVAEGVQSGYRVAGVREGSVYAALGLLDGDVVESINGVALTDAEQAMTTLGGSERGAVLQISRAGVSTTCELRIAGGLAWAQVLGLPLRPVGGAPDEALPEEPVPEETVPRVATRPGGSGSSVPAGARPGKPAPADPLPGKPAGTPGAGGAGVQCAADGSCSVARKAFDAMVADPDRLLAQVQVSEANNGYRLSGIRGDSDVARLGFRSGDVVTAVNGTSLDDQLGLLGLYGGLGSTRTYNVTYQRGGVRHTRTIRLRD
jgi:membrane-associated protease RseP (regulator of RpoE activity)